MAQVINTNIASLTAQRNLATSQRDAATAMQRLSSGLRINSAKDDAAGLAIANRLTSQINGINQAIRNSNDGLSVAQVAEGALAETTNILQRMRELAVQSANASNSSADRTALQTEVTQLISEIDRIATNTSFGQTKLLNGNFTNQTFQVGANVGETIDVSLSSAKADALGTVYDVSFGGSLTINRVDTTGNDTVNGVAAQTLTLGVDGTSTTVSVAAAASAKSIAADISSQVAGLSATASTVATVEFNQAGAGGAADIVNVNGVALTVDLSGASVALKATALATAIAGETSLSGLTVSDDGAGKLTITDADGDDITFGAGATFNANSDFDVEVVVNGAESADDNNINAAGDDVAVTGDIDFTTGSNVTVTLGSDDTTGNVVSSASATGTNTASTNRVDDISIATVTGANTALGIIDSALTTIDSQRATLGAIQSRFDSVISNLSNVSENSSAARSRIMDADFAAETAALAKNQILQQAGISVLAQANAQPQNVLALLQ
jgi:flagellin